MSAVEADEVRSYLEQATRFATDALDALAKHDIAGGIGGALAGAYLSDARSALELAAAQARRAAALAEDLSRALTDRRVPDTLPPEPEERPWSLDEEVLP